MKKTLAIFFEIWYDNRAFEIRPFGWQMGECNAINDIKSDNPLTDSRSMMLHAEQDLSARE